MALSSNSSMTDFPSLIKSTSASTSPDKNLLTGTTGTVYHMHLDNSSGGAKNWLKIYDTIDVTHGTTLPIFCVPVPSSSRLRVYSKQGITISTALSACGAGGGGTAGGAVTGTLNYQLFGS